MGNKIHPIGFRLGPVYTWTSRWFANRKRYSDLLLEDVKIRHNLMTKFRVAGISRVEIERSINKINLTLFVSRPGVVIGRGGTGLEDLKKWLQKDFGDSKLDLKVEPVKEPNLDAYLVGTNIADQLLKRLPAKRILRQAIEKVMTAGAKGVRIRLVGRINGAEIARVEHSQAGVLPFSSIKEKIDFATVPVRTRSGYIGVKVWICQKD
ncbi:30S ribosomal protein S3 [Candidatus Gottesmanbacteria bacterium]|nr:30S ribosomal protein S3 [Candidatus Gottesmanbacteria bacterium]